MIDVRLPTAVVPRLWRLTRQALTSGLHARSWVMVQIRLQDTADVYVQRRTRRPQKGVPFVWRPRSANWSSRGVTFA